MRMHAFVVSCLLAASMSQAIAESKCVVTDRSNVTSGGPDREHPTQAALNFSQVSGRVDNNGKKIQQWYAIHLPCDGKVELRIFAADSDLRYEIHNEKKNDGITPIIGSISKGTTFQISPSFRKDDYVTVGVLQLAQPSGFQLDASMIPTH